jgi:hypothetical protein
MDHSTKKNLLQFYELQVDKVGDLATWISAPQRKYHRHEFFGLEIATLTVEPGTTIRLRDLGYGGCGLVGTPWAERLAAGPVELDAELRILDESRRFKLVTRHVRALQAGCEFLDVTDAQRNFLRSYIQYMDAALLLRQAEPDSVFPAFRGPGWLNLSAHKQAIRFSVRFHEAPERIEANLIYVYEGSHIYCTWKPGHVGVGVLNEKSPLPADQKVLLRQIIAILVGIRQGASLAGFSPVIERVIAQLDAG